MDAEHRLGGQLRQQRIACFLTASAGVSTDATVFHAMLAMFLALVAAEFAGLSACLEKCPTQRRLEGGLAGQNVAGRGADISAIQVEANTADQRLHLLFAEAGVGASGASLGAVEAGPNTLDQCANVHRRFLRSRLSHWLCVRHVSTQILSRRTLTLVRIR